jgi:biopolymer transport protein ExbD
MKAKAFMTPVVLSVIMLTATVARSQQKINGSGSVKKETRNADKPFDEIGVSGNYKVYISQGSKQSITVEAEENLLPYIETEIDGNDLGIGTKEGYNIRPTKDVVIRITVVKLESLAASGKSSFFGEGTIKGEDLEVGLSGETEASLSLDYSKLEIGISGKGKVKLNGRADKSELAISGDGDIAAADLKAKDMEVAISGNGNAHVQATGKLEIAISGNGKVKYRGSPSSVEQSVSGKGVVQQE